MTSGRRRDLIHKYSDGMCGSCDKLATTKIVYDMGDSHQKAEVIERYCDKHLTLVTATDGIDQTVAIRKVDKKSLNSA